jgi:hypothetical protein
MTEPQQLENLLAGGNGGSVTLPRKQAQELAQKLRARGGGEGLARLETLLARPGDVEVDRDEAQKLLEELRASGRRWVFGTNEPRPLATAKTPEREPEPERQREAEPEPKPEPEREPTRQRGFLSRLFGRSDG